ncbi:hypothetical protein M422DRAFT_25092 [Sphaerobolus stellatus SS14]|nr:hypothetical protein M422DRAFT_25092 [Sphaerobolus stellatus SS14]
MKIYVYWIVRLLLHRWTVMGALAHSSREVTTIFQARTGTSGVPSFNVPAKCQTACQGFAEIQKACLIDHVDIQCLCGNASISSVLSCFNCIIALPDTDPGFREKEEEILKGGPRTYN